MLTPIKSSIPITFKNMQAQWRDAVHKFDVNLWNFEIEAGQAATSIFQRSFELKRFNSSNSSPWAPRAKGRKYKHPLMKQTGSLQKSIKWKRLSNTSRNGVLIYTDPDGFQFTARHQGFCYAAVHNAPNSLKTRTGSVKNMPRRQFMGHSSVLKEKLNELSKVILHGLPK